MNKELIAVFEYLEREKGIKRELIIAAVEEALDYCRRFRDVIEADADDELALSEELIRPRSAIP